MDFIIQLEHVLVTIATFFSIFGTLTGIIWRMSVKNAERRKEIQLRLEGIDTRFEQHAREDARQHSNIEKLTEDTAAIRETMIRVETVLDHMIVSQPKKKQEEA